MRPTVSAGDLALAAQPATRETFRPFGTVITPGERAYVGRRGKVLVTQDRRRPAPRRIESLGRYPQAKRIVTALGTTPLWLAVHPGGDLPDAQPAAFLVPGGVTVVIDAGVWHAGPVPLAETTILELLEAVGSSDRYDRSSVTELTGAQALRVLLPADPGAEGGALDLAAPNAVLVDASLHGRMRLGCLVVDDVAPPADGDALETELAQVAEGLRAMWGQAEDLGEIPGIAVGRDLYREVGLDLDRHVPRAETLVAQVLAGSDVPQEGALARTLALLALRLGLPIAAYDGGSVGDQVLVRTGAAGEEYAGADGRRIPLEGHPVLCGSDGPFGSPVGDRAEALPGSHTRRVLVVLYLPPRVEDATIEAWLDAVARTLRTHAGGRDVGRLLVG